MEVQTLQWTDQFGRVYEYSPYEASLIGTAPVGFSSDATLAIAEASSALGSVPALPAAGVASVLYRSESSASSLIEGVGPGPRRILEAEIADEGEVNDEEARRVVGNLEALRDAMTTEIPAKPGDLLRWHQKLMEGHPRMAAESIGAFRTKQNWIGGDSSGPRHAEFIPPQPEDVPVLIDDLVAFCARTDLTPVAHAAIAHARFEVIHPFVDGNGRVGRFLIQQLLRRRLALPSPIPLSVIWAEDTDRYIEGLRAYQEGDIDSWLQLFSRSVIRAVEWMTDISDRTIALLAEFRARVDTRGESVTVRVIDDLPVHPIVDSQAVASRYGVTPQSAHAALVRLEEAGVLSERPFARRRKGRPRRMFAATELIDLLA
jgi:Fic family protein